jgi:hypothetical protein
MCVAFSCDISNSFNFSHPTIIIPIFHRTTQCTLYIKSTQLSVVAAEGSGITFMPMAIPFQTNLCKIRSNITGGSIRTDAVSIQENMLKQKEYWIFFKLMPFLPMNVLMFLLTLNFQTLTQQQAR